MNENLKIKGAIDLFNETDAKTVLDIGCNKGYFCAMIADSIDAAVGFDYDENCVDMAREAYNIENINYANFGIMHLDKSRQFRYEADITVSLAVMHHFATAGLDSAEVADIISNLSKKWIIIEDIGPYGTYHRVFRDKGFELIKRIDSQPNSRKLSLFKRKGPPL